MNKELKSERLNISAWDFYAPLQITELNEMDIEEHELQVEAVYKELLHERRVIDECRWRFDRTFKRIDYYMVRIK